MHLFPNSYLFGTWFCLRFILNSQYIIILIILSETMSPDINNNWIIKNLRTIIWRITSRSIDFKNIKWNGYILFFANIKPNLSLETSHLVKINVNYKLLGHMILLLKKKYFVFKNIIISSKNRDEIETSISTNIMD